MIVKKNGEKVEMLQRSTKKATDLQFNYPILPPKRFLTPAFWKAHGGDISSFQPVCLRLWLPSGVPKCGDSDGIVFDVIDYFVQMIQDYTSVWLRLLSQQRLNWAKTRIAFQ